MLRDLRLILVLLSLVVSACATATQSTAPRTAAVPITSSPSGGRTFDFCVDEDPSTPLNLRDAAWLAFFAANEYAHASTFGPMLASLGFANPNLPGDMEWEDCTGDLRQLRLAETKHEAELAAALGTPKLRGLSESLLPSDASWGRCARDYLARESLRRDVFPAAAFQEALVHEVHPGAYLQFFTAGATSKDGRRFQDQSTQVVFARHREKNVAVLVFRGTEPSQRADVLADLKVWKTPLAKHGYPEGWGEAHSGFVEAFESVAPLLDKKLAELEGTGVKLYITGHSLGGALATLAAAHLLRSDAPKVTLAGVYTFGSPRVGDAAFAKAFRSATKKHGVKTVRVRNDNDLVTRIPGLTLEYEHVGTLAFLQEDKLLIAPEPEPVYASSSAADHGISGFGAALAPRSGYYRRLLALLKSRAHPELDRCGTEK